MRQLYYTVQILLRGRGSNFIKLVSLTLGLLIGILLFSQIAYELSYENFYKDPENVALLRCRRVKDGISDKEYYVATHTNWLHLCLSFSHRVKHADFLVTRSRLERLSP